MRLMTPVVVLSAALLAASPAWATPRSARETPPQVERERGPRPASAAELERYAERERQASGLEDFEGGRRGSAIATSTIIIVLLVVIIVLIVL